MMSFNLFLKGSQHTQSIEQEQNHSPSQHSKELSADLIVKAGGNQAQYMRRPPPHTAAGVFAHSCSEP